MGAPSRHSRREQIVEAPRARILRAMVDVAAERGFAGASVTRVTARAGVSSRTFYREFGSRDECFIAVLDLALDHPAAVIAEAFAREKRWRDGALRALASLLVFFEAEPQLTRVWFVEAVAAGRWALVRWEQIVSVLRTRIVDYLVHASDAGVEPRAATGVMASVLGLIQTHLLTEEPGPLIELLGPLMGLVTALFLDPEEVTREVRRGGRIAREIRAGDLHWTSTLRLMGPAAKGQMAIPGRVAYPPARRARECLLFLAEHPGASNREVAAGIGVVHQSQISRLLAELASENLLTKDSEGAGKRNAWQLTPRGKCLARGLS